MEYEENEGVTQYKNEDIVANVKKVPFIPVHSTRKQVFKKTEFLLKLITKMKKGEVFQILIADLQIIDNEKHLLQNRYFGSLAWLKRTHPNLKWKCYARGFDIYIRRK